MMMEMGFEPAMFFSMTPSVFWIQAIVILIFALVIGIYPVIYISRMKIMHALRGQ
jgi:ABC-type antimicrobial peptide transport system permease subunit